MRGAAGVNVMGNVVNITAGGRATLRAEVRCCHGVVARLV